MTRLPRFWFYRPQLYWYGWRTLLPVARGADEWNRHTLVLGWNFTGQLIIPYFQCVDPFEKPGVCPWEEKE